MTHAQRCVRRSSSPRSLEGLLADVARSRARSPYPAGAGTVMLPMLPRDDYEQTIIFAGGMTPERDDVRDRFPPPSFLLFPPLLPPAVLLSTSPFPLISTPYTSLHPRPLSHRR